MSEFKGFAAGSTEAQVLQTLAYMFKPAPGAGSPGFAQSGVIAGLAVSQTATASGSVVVGAGMGVVQASVTAGASPLVSNADKTVDVFTGSPMGALPRYDLVVFDSATAAIVVLPGTPNASPTDPSFAPWQLPLARIRNAANATTIPTSAIDDLRVTISLNVPDGSKSQVITPVYTNTAGESLSIGDGTITGRWRVSGTGTGQTCTFQFKLTRGAGTNVGTGSDWAIQLPTPGVDSGTAIGSGLMTTGSTRKQLTLEMASSTILVFRDSAGNRIGPSNPGGTASSQAGHVYQGTITYFLP